MIGDPPLKGGVQVIVTPVFETTTVEGAAGWLGLAAALTYTSEE